MADTPPNPEDALDVKIPKARKIEDPVAKGLRLEKERGELVAALDSADFTAMKTRVGAVLNLHPDARNSDVTLALKYWELFQPDLYNPNGIRPKDLFKLERFHYIVRARAKIQNEYGLFQADEAVQRHRRAHEEDMQEAVIRDSNPRRLLSIFSDEIGKTDRFVIVASVWMLDAYAMFSLTRSVFDWKARSAWAKREVHFSKFGKNDAEPLTQYLDVINANRQFLGFKFIAIERSRTRRSIEDIVAKLHEHMLIVGSEHEIATGRFDLPREVTLTVDEEQSLDPFALSEMKRRINDAYAASHGEGLILTEAKSASSRNSAPIQLADVLAGALNRRMNHEGDRNIKDDLADMIIERLGLDFAEAEFPALDSSAFFHV